MPRTLIIGDEEAVGLFNALKRLPAALDPGPLWLRSHPFSDMQWWAEHQEIKDAIEDIAHPKGGVSAPERLPDTVLVALGRREILTEPDAVAQKDVDLVVGDALAVVAQIRALSPALNLEPGKALKIVWVMPLFANNEGKTRAALDAAFRANGISMVPTIFSPRDQLQDPNTRLMVPPKEIPDSTFDLLARLVQAAVPLRGPKVPSPPAVPSAPENGQGTLADAYDASLGAVHGLSTRAKLGAALAVVGLGLGAAYLATRRR